MIFVSYDFCLYHRGNFCPLFWRGSLSDSDYLEIEEKIMKAFGWDDVDTDSVQKALKLICYEKAEFHFNEKNKKSFY
jgi:hypothetical protein